MRVPRGQVVTVTKLLRIDGAQLRVVAAAALGNVVIKAGDIQQIRLGQATENAPGQGVSILVFRAIELAQMLNQVERVCVDRVDMEKDQVFGECFSCRLSMKRISFYVW